jgi:hypothetical protein
MFWNKIVAIVGNVIGAKHKADGRSDKGILVFHHTSEVIRAESLLKEAGFTISVKGPPPDLRTGCDLVIETPLKILPLQDLLLEPVGLFQTKDFGDHLMVRAANMKITIDKSDLRIVNVSGGGCPDVPFLAESLVGRSLRDAPPPRSIGHTLCGYALQLAYEELLRRCPG